MAAQELPDRSTLESVASRVEAEFGATPSRQWPLLSNRLGTELWVKHENHTPIGAFKVRGGLIYLQEQKRRQPDLDTVVAATRGNHGQSIALAAARLGVRAVIVVPKGNNPEKNAAMRALGGSLVEVGEDFQEAYEFAVAQAASEGWHLVPSFDPGLLAGVASYAMEFFRDAPPLDVVYVPIGLGSGICAVIAVRDALGLATEVVGVVAAGAPAYALSFEAREVTETDLPQTMADGLAVRVPHPLALEIILAGASRVVQVTEEEIAGAMRHYFTDTHNVAEGAGAASLAAALQEAEALRGRRVGVILSGGNVDRATYLSVLAGASAAERAAP